MGKVGRPRKDDSKNKVITIRVTKDELNDLNYVSSRSGLSKSEIIIQGMKMNLNLIRNRLKT